MGNQNLIIFENNKMKILSVLLLVCMVGLAYQQAMWTCGKFEVQNGSGHVTKYRIKPRMGGTNFPGYCVRQARRRLQAVVPQEPNCGHRRLAKKRGLQAMIPYKCPIMSGHQCYQC